MLEVVFRIIKETTDIEGFEIFQRKLIFTTYADDTTFFLKNTEPVINPTKSSSVGLATQALVHMVHVS